MFRRMLIVLGLFLFWLSCASAKSLSDIQLKSGTLTSGEIYYAKLGKTIELTMEVKGVKTTIKLAAGETIKRAKLESGTITSGQFSEDTKLDKESTVLNTQTTPNELSISNVSITNVNIKDSIIKNAEIENRQGTFNLTGAEINGAVVNRAAIKGIHPSSDDLIVLSSLLSAPNAKGETPEIAPNIWRTTMMAGVQFLPDYTTEGANNGLKKARPYLSINIDNRTQGDHINGSHHPTDRMPGRVLNYGLDLLLLGSTGTAPSTIANDTPKFTEVTSTEDLSFYANVVPASSWFDPIPGSEIAIGVRAGFQSRDKVSNNSGEIDSYALVGVTYTYFTDVPANRYQRGPYDSSENREPDFLMKLYRGYFEEYGGHSKENRIVFDFDKRIVKNSDFFIGGAVNAGHRSEPNDYSLRFAYRVDLQKLINKFSPPATSTPDQEKKSA